MKGIMTTVSICLGIAMACGVACAQVIPGTGNASLDPCPGGHANGIPETIGDFPTLANLVNAADLILVGRVSDQTAATLINPNERSLIETDSVIAVEQILSGRLPTDKSASAVLLSQLGGEVAQCKFVVQGDPIVTIQERYILFLKRDNRQMPANTSGMARYYSVGERSGKVQIINGKIQFASSVGSDGLTEYNNTDANGFIRTLTEVISLVKPKKAP
jgi:hypothetical protein